MENEHKKGILYGVAAYVIWGLLPVYWKQVQNVPTMEILANRFLWSAVFIVLLLAVRGRLGLFAQETKQVFSAWRSGCCMIAAAVSIAVNWGVFIWAVGNGHILATSLGYYINPLMSVLLGLVFLKEKLRKLEWLAVALASAGIAFLIARTGSLPWVSLVVPGSFAVYGLLKKYLKISAFNGILLETLIISPFMLFYLVRLWLAGGTALQTQPLTVSFFLAGAGAVTATPLILFTACAQLLPLNMVGFLQYISPNMTLLLGIFVYDEPFTPTLAFTFGCIWLGLACYITSRLRSR